MIFYDEIDNWKFKNLALISGKILFTQPLKLHEKLFTQTFYVRKFLSPNPFLFGTNPSVNNERSLKVQNYLAYNWGSDDSFNGQTRGGLAW